MMNVCSTLAIFGTLQNKYTTSLRSIMLEDKIEVIR